MVEKLALCFLRHNEWEIQEVVFKVVQALWEANVLLKMKFLNAICKFTSHLLHSRIKLVWCIREVFLDGWKKLIWKISEASETRLKWNVSFSVNALCNLQDSERHISFLWESFHILYTYNSSSILPPLPLELLVCLMKWFWIFIMLNPVRFKS